MAKKKCCVVADDRQYVAAVERLSSLRAERNAAKARLREAEAEADGLDSEAAALLAGESRPAQDLAKLRHDVAVVSRGVELGEYAVQQALAEARDRVVQQSRSEYMDLIRRMRKAADALGQLIDEEIAFIENRGLVMAVTPIAGPLGRYASASGWQVTPILNLVRQCDVLLAEDKR